MKDDQETTQNSQYTLLNTTNFHTKLSCGMSEILQKYANLIIEYTSFISEKVNIKNKKYYNYIYDRGLDTISHVFSLILFYTKNLDITYYHSQKAFYFYVEFIEQIIDIQHSFLQLSSRDACIFVYKKTVYEINNEYRKTIDTITVTKDTRFELLNSYIEIYKILIKRASAQFKEINDILSYLDYSFSQMVKMLQIIHLYADKIYISDFDDCDTESIDVDVFMMLINQLKYEPLDNKIAMKLKTKIIENEPITKETIATIFSK
jgi:hypothetical protein